MVAHAAHSKHTMSFAPSQVTQSNMDVDKDQRDDSLVKAFGRSATLANKAVANDYTQHSQLFRKYEHKEGEKR